MKIGAKVGIIFNLRPLGTLKKGMSAFVISKRLDGDYKFKFVNRKGKTIFTSIACKQKADCLLMIEAITEKTSDFTFTRKRTGSGKYYFRLSRNGLVLANSRKFSTELMLKKGIDQILKYVSRAETLDFSENDIFPEVAPYSEEKIQ